MYFFIVLNKKPSHPGPAPAPENPESDVTDAIGVADTGRERGEGGFSEQTPGDVLCALAPG